MPYILSIAFVCSFTDDMNKIMNVTRLQIHVFIHYGFGVPVINNTQPVRKCYTYVCVDRLE